MARRPRQPAAQAGAGQAAPPPGSAGAAGSAVEDAADELYAVGPERFVADRDARARALRSSGEREAAVQVAALRRPTQGAWLVNLLVREQPDVVADLLALGEALRDAGLDAATLRSLSGQRRHVVDALVRDAARMGLARGARVSADTRGEVQSTLEAALLDPDVAAQVRRGRLERAAVRAGFPAGGAAPEDPGPRVQRSRQEDQRQEDRRQEQERRRREARQAAEAGVRAAHRARDVAQRAADEAEAEQRLVAERLEHLRIQVSDGERRLAEHALQARTAAAELSRRDRALTDAQKALSELG